MHVLLQIPDHRAQHFLEHISRYFPTVSQRPVVVSDDGHVAYVDRVADLVDEHLVEMYDDIPHWADLPQEVRQQLALELAEMPQWHFPDDDPIDEEQAAQRLRELMGASNPN